jgi:CRISPR type I-E-associated protein CasB/Cse2
LGDDEAERRWAVVIRGIALLEGALRGEREPPTMGIALARAAVAELRFLKLLRSSEDALPDELRRLARLMAGRNQPFDWTDAWWLLVTAGRPDARIRRQLARDYYRTRAALDATLSKDAA